MSLVPDHVTMISMIEVKKLNGQSLWINPDQIRWIESTPDTVVTFADGTKLTLLSSLENIETAIAAFRRRIYSSSQGTTTENNLKGEAPWIS